MIRGQEYDSHTQLSMLVILILKNFGLVDFGFWGIPPSHKTHSCLFFEWIKNIWLPRLLPLSFPWQTDLGTKKIFLNLGRRIFFTLCACNPPLKSKRRCQSMVWDDGASKLKNYFSMRITLRRSSYVRKEP